jgi:hypothetical protein
VSCLLTLAANAICLLSPTELTLRADISTQVAGDFRYTNQGHDYHGGHVGRMALDLPLVTYRGFRLVGGYEHTCLVDTPHDRGQERVYLGFTYRIFGGAL